MSYQKGIFFRGFPYLLLTVLLYFSIYGVRLYLNFQNNPQTISREFQKQIEVIESEAKNQISDLILKFDSCSEYGTPSEIKNSSEKDKKDEIFLFVYKSDTLVYWNNNKVILPEDFDYGCKRSNFACHLKNGWYGFQCQKKGSYSFLGCFLIKSEFPFQNEFIKNQFSSRFDLPQLVTIEFARGSFPIYASDGTVLFGLVFNTDQGSPFSHNDLILILFILGSLSLFYLLFRIISEMKWFETRESTGIIIFGFIVIILRIAQNYYRFPAEIYRSELFTPALYSSSAVLPSLGDFTLNATIIFLVSLAYYKKGSVKLVVNKSRLSKQIARDSIFLLIILVFFHAVGYLVTDLIINSSVSLNLQNISGLTYGSGFGFFIITSLMFSLWLVSAKIFDDIISKRSRAKWLAISVIIAACAYSLICRIAGLNVNFTVTLFFIIYVAWYWYFNSATKTLFSVQNLLFFLCFYAIYSTFLLNKSNQTKEMEELNLLAVKLVKQRNPVTEELYEQVEKRLQSDSILNQWITGEPVNKMIFEDSLVKYLEARYFNAYWKKYQIQITCCDQTKELRIQPQGYQINCYSYFHSLVSSYGQATSIPNLFYLDYGFGKEYYLAEFSGEADESTSKKQSAIFIEFNLKNAFPDPGYPGLLMDKTRLDIPNLSDYSYGLFQNGHLIRSVGTLGYKTELCKYQEFSAHKVFFTDDHRIHFQYHINDQDTLIISKKEDNLLTLATPFSYLFIIFSTMSLFVAGIIKFPRRLNAGRRTLRNRLHFSLIGILVLTMLAIGIVQAINIIQINAQKNIDNLREKAYSVVVEVQHKYSSFTSLRDVTKIELGDFLVKLSNVFFTDINVFNEQGMLVSSSRPQIFEEGLLSERMNGMAYQRLVVEKNSIYIHNESIGDMQFNSAYLPFYNEHNQMFGFVNLPYFAKQDESKKEISSFLVTFLNIYILLILFGMLITVLISNHITLPLAMLADKMSRLRLGIANEKISWRQNDEIGQLVAEYNRMIDELGRSAELLAKSERESAWREMARQVAHEIKNPLTPMKLSAQYLEKAWKENAPDWDQRLFRFTRALVEQIDALSVIASDFSNFAKMPPVVFERVDLKEVIWHVLSLYQDTTPIRYEFQSEGPESFILGERSQLIRVFTNLLNNAIQAIGDHQTGIIRINLAQERQNITVSVSDNGCGISPAGAGKIFQPDFTTKTSGMGLGLAIVRGIIEGMDGEITFSSEERKGTTFMIKFPTNG